ncbi:MAG: cyclic nucleotide-binding domain-containing protein [Gammaproteobacteria bacterium]|nr:MAG: cyclic nucleotide-binding domain-containing protein [Gammaproteobacteria bacterium]
MSDEKQNYAELIRNLIPINELPPLTQNEFINKAGLIKVKKGKFVFKQGDRDEFSYYLLEGEIALIANDSQHNLISAGADRARYAMAQLQPRQFSARANVNSVVLQINRNSLDKLLVMQDQKKPESNAVEELVSTDIEVSDIGEEEDVDWMTRMLQSELFSRMPMTSIQGLFALLEPVELKAGDVVIKQGEPGEDYYIIASGACQVSRKPPSGGKDINLAVLKAGDSFGEEALITETVRNATVSMLTDGTVMKLSKDNFIELIKKPALQSIKYEEAAKKVASGSTAWLDVRYKNEHDASGIAGSINIPSNILRTQMDKLDRSKHYIVYCDTGGRSSTAVFLLLEEGFEASYLEGGLMHNTQAARKSEVSSPPVMAPAKAPAPTPAPPESEEEDDDPDVRASVLEADLARTNMQLESIEKIRKETVAAMSEQDMQAEIERRLKAERAQIEAAKREAEEEAKRLRQFEEEKIRRMREEAEKRMREEKVKLEQVYSRNAEEMEKLERMRQEATEQLRRQKAQLDLEAEQARRNMEEAERIRKELEQSRESIKAEALEKQRELEQSRESIKAEALEKRRELEQSRESIKAEALVKQKEQDAMQKKIQEEVMQKMADAHKLREEVEEARRRLEAESEKKRQEQQQMELQIQAKAREKLEVERRKLAEEFSRAQEEMEKAKREQAAAGAARKAAKEEAEKIIAEFKQKHDIDRKAEEERLRAERVKLEQEQRKLQEAQLAITKARAEAEAARRAAQDEAGKLHARHAALDAEKDRLSRMKIEAEIAAAEVKLKQADREIEQAEMAEVETAAASQVNENDLMKQGLLEEELSKQLAEDLQEFRVEQDEQEKKFATIASQMEHMRRIKGKAEAAKQAVKNANSSLLDEIAAQLGGGDKR